jgi:hypothetical protein
MHLSHSDEPCTPVAEPHIDHHRKGPMPLLSSDQDYYLVWLRSHSHDDVSLTRGLVHRATV